MPPLANQRHELFAQALAKGKTASEAYALAGYKPNDGNASVLKGKQNVAARVQELQAKGAERAEVTVQSLIDEAEAARKGAMAEGQFSAAVAAIKEKGILSGKRIERSEHGEPGEFEAMADDELYREAAREAAELGMMDAGDTQH